VFILRWLIGFGKTFVNLWSFQEWFYYTRTGLDPKLPAFQRWDIRVREDDKVPETASERLLPTKNRWVILKDKFSQRPDDVLFFTTDPDKVKALVDEYRRELRTRTSGEFFYTMVKGRRLEAFHDFHLPVEPLPASQEVSEEEEREKFLR